MNKRAWTEFSKEVPPRAVLPSRMMMMIKTYDEENEVEENDVDVDIESDEDMIELEAEVMSEEEEDEFDEREKMILEFKNEMDYKFVGDNDMNDADVVDEIKSDEKVYSRYFTEEMIAKLYSMDKVHDKDSIEYGIPDNRYWTYDSCESYLRDGSDEEDYIEDSESDEKAGNKMKKKGCFAFLSRVFNRLFKKN
nr:uncharacterized protein LOC107439710 isoform X3 [Parasteatoda tepidariorum]